MASEPKPRAVNRIALRDGKERAEALITTRYSEGLLDGDELEQRLEQLQDAETLSALEELIEDLVEPGTDVSAALVPVRAATPALASARPSVALARLEDVSPERTISAVFASLEKTGAWAPARVNHVVDVFGEATLDFREAVLAPGTTEIEVKCVFSSLVILAPPGLPVRVDANVIFGDIERDENVAEQPASPGDPLIVLTGLVLFASVEIHERLEGESRRDARRRRRRRRRELRRAARRKRRALPP